MNTRFGAVLQAARQFWLAWVLGAAMAVTMVVLAALEDLPVRDPDDDLLPSYVRMPLIVVGTILVDIVPRVVHRARRRGSLSPATLAALWREVVAERWPASHWWFAVNGAVAWYLTYATFRNIKSMAPFVNGAEWDSAMAEVDRFLFAGHDPAAVLHAWFGTGLMAHLMSAVYVVWIVMVPASIAIALVWTRHTRAGSWYVTAVAVDWCLGAVIYLLLPSLGPIYADPREFADLPHTFNTTLQEGLWTDRVAVMADPWAAGTLQTIAAFASLHVGIMMTICLVARLVGLPRWVQTAAWVFLALTVLATVYLGWHYVVDVLGGLALGAFAVWVAALATGNRVGWRPRLTSPAEPSSAAHPAALASRSGPLPDRHAAD
ncbi:phosphatase PAP2 family protein [Nocardioides sp. TF02-7]|uniref:phosphatase PAP2 family protein n=1 Tax=Nocardioides sp. TF02-7 TaxID=2917724 RepID=UPI001F053908|nr:phosphatase PAP2 family protein [Nocardioides sp. TF02-7]UMG93211.1 phosphatase PAP2 family protein [Nocardioides sp. TF02-7]